MEVIRFYRVNEDYGCFSNFAPHPITLKGKEWPTSEHYFQAQKFVGTEHEEAIRLAKSPTIAARMGRSWERPLRPDWEEVKDDVMREAAAALLERAGIPIDPQVPVCVCSIASYADVAAAVLGGARSLEEVCAATGLRSGCGIYCVASALRILKAAGADMTPPKGHRWYDVTVSLWDLRGGPLDGAAGSWVREDLEAFGLCETAGERTARRDEA